MAGLAVSLEQRHEKTFGMFPTVMYSVFRSETHGIINSISKTHKSFLTSYI